MDDEELIVGGGDDLDYDEYDLDEEQEKALLQEETAEEMEDDSITDKGHGAGQYENYEAPQEQQEEAAAYEEEAAVEPEAQTAPSGLVTHATAEEAVEEEEQGVEDEGGSRDRFKSERKISVVSLRTAASNRAIPDSLGMSDPGEVLVVGDSRVSGWLPTSFAPWTVRSVVRKDAKLPALIDEANSAIVAKTKLIVMVALHYDLTYLTNYSEETRGCFLKLYNPPPINEILTVLSGADYQWRAQKQLAVVWALPYVPDFLHFNSMKALNVFGITHLDVMHTAEAKWAARTMEEHIKTIGLQLDKKGILYINMNDLVPRKGFEFEYDGVHLAPSMKNDMLKGLISQALKVNPQETKLTLKKFLPVSARETKITKKKRQRMRYRLASKLKQSNTVL